MKRISYVALLAVIVVGSFLAGSWFTQRASVRKDAPEGRRVLYYVDPMHPAYKSDKPGIAPDCGMELVPVYEDGSMGGSSGGAGDMPPGTVNVTADKQQLIGVRVGVVERMAPASTVRIFGRVVVDENRVHRVVSPTEGWLRELHGGTTGSLVKKDQILSTFYSRDLLSSQQAFFFALNTLDRYKITNAAEDQLMAAGQQIRAAEANLMSLGMSEAQMEELKRTRKPAREFEIRAPATGFVLARNVFPNLRFDRNTELYRIADISRVWIVADLFENEARYFTPGVAARGTLSGTPGKAFHPRVTEVLPQVDPATRTFRVRMEADNPDYLLRPDMFVDVELPVKLPPSIAVPADAVVDSGAKKLVYVDKGNGVFEPRRVETGWRAGNQVEIVKGLMPGEKIVIAGTFLIDSESRMKAAAAGITGESSECPVCGMEVGQAKAKAAGLTSEFRGQTYYFCADEDKVKFDQAPTKYSGKGGRDATTDAGTRLGNVQWAGGKAKGNASAHVGHVHPPVSLVGESGSR
jgi:membrane fusion protein, copper/silver efflux system